MDVTVFGFVAFVGVLVLMAAGAPDPYDKLSQNVKMAVAAAGVVLLSGGIIGVFGCIALSLVEKLIA